MSLSDIYTEICAEIGAEIGADTSIGAEISAPCVIYTGVGAAAGTTGVLALKDYQQYPPFLQDVRKLLPETKMYLVLVDPYQEDPPYVVRDFQLKCRAKNRYESLDKKVQVYVWRQSVRTVVDAPNADSVDITSALQTLNQFAIAHRFTTVYHDFTGRRNHVLAEHFDEALGAHLDHVIYGLSAREDHGCYFNLAETGAFMPIRVTAALSAQRPLITFFNYFKFIVTDRYQDVAAERAAYSPYVRALIDVQHGQIVEGVRKDVCQNILSIFRVVHQLRSQSQQTTMEHSMEHSIEHSIEHYTYLFHDMLLKDRGQFTALLHARQFDTLFEALKHYYSPRLHKVARLNDLAVDGYELLSFILQGKNEYEWQLNMRAFF